MDSDSSQEDISQLSHENLQLAYETLRNKHRKVQQAFQQPRQLSPNTMIQNELNSSNWSCHKCQYPAAFYYALQLRRPLVLYACSEHKFWLEMIAQWEKQDTARVRPLAEHNIQLPMQKKERQITFKKVYMQVMQEQFNTQVTDLEDKLMIETWKHASAATRQRFAKGTAEEQKGIVREMILKRNSFLAVREQITEELNSPPRPREKSREDRTRSASGTKRKTKQLHRGN